MVIGTVADLIAGVSQVIRRAGEEHRKCFLGTCFALQRSTHFLTAAHCIGHLSARQIGVATPGASSLLTVTEVIKHPSADVAVLRATNDKVPANRANPFRFLVYDYTLGETFFSFGFPEVLSDDVSNPPPRLFKGHFQRFMQHERNRYRYKAGELSIPCPAGSSGSPVFNPNGGDLYGLISEDIESYTIAAEKEVHLDGSVGSEVRKVINYGVCVMLPDIKDWVFTHIPQALYR